MTAMNAKPASLTVNFDGVPQVLQELPQWVCWKYIHRNDGWRKVPMTPSGGWAKSTDPATWSTFDQVQTAYLLGEHDFDGVGITLGDGLCGVDLDDHVSASGLDDTARDAVSSISAYWEISPSGTGIKGICRTRLQDSVKRQAVGVEFYPHGRYFAVTGHLIDNRLGDDQTDEVRSFLERHVDQVGGVRSGSGDPDLDAWLEYDQQLRRQRMFGDDQWTLDRVKAEILPHLDGEWYVYDEWLKVGAALHHHSGGDPEWLEAWDEWSSLGPGYEDGACELKWDSFDQSRGRPVTIASLLHATKGARQEQKAKTRLEHVEELRQGILACSDVEALKAYCRDQVAVDKDIDAVDRDGVLVPAVEQRYTALTGNRLKKDLARGMVKPPAGAATSTGPEWLRPWVYVTNGDFFFDTRTKATATRAGFDAMHSTQMPLSQDNIRRERASEYAVHVWGVTTVANTIYAPGQDPVFEDLGSRWANTYREDSVPVAKAGDGAIVKMVEGHIARLFPDPREAGLLRSWLAFNVRSPGVKTRWTPYVYGAQGTGKTFFAELLGLTMGDDNVRVIGGRALLSDFNGWASGSSVVVVEEVYQTGHRFEAEETLKAPIANSVVDVHKKGVDRFKARNYTNYLLLSNHPDGIPIGTGDRRYFFLRAALTSGEAIDLEREGYYTNLFDSCREHPGELRQWLLTCDLHPEFEPNGRAPVTGARDQVIELSRSDAEQALRDAAGEHQVITTRWASGVLRAAGLGDTKSRALSKALMSAGFDFHSRIRINGVYERVYTGPKAPRFGSDKALREAVEASGLLVPDGFGAEE